MRMMLKVKIDTEKGNEALKSGRLPQVMEGLMAKLQPEAAYFGVEDGDRCAWIVFDLADTASMPTVGEPLFMELGASVYVSPVMNGEDLAKGLSML
jgi:hypothetical protein